MDEKQIEKLAQELSEQDLNDLAAGRLNPKTEKVLKYVGIGVGSAAALTGAGVGIAALVGWRTGRGPFRGLHGEPAASAEKTDKPLNVEGFNVLTLDEKVKNEDPSTAATNPYTFESWESRGHKFGKR